MTTLKKTINKEATELKKKLKEFEEKSKEYLEGWQRERADFANYKKDIQKYIDNSRESMKEEIIIKYLNIIDAIELMVKHVHDAIAKSDWYKGVEHTHAQAVKMLQGFGVEKIEVKAGDRFDPNLHEALEGEGGIIKEILQSGYKMGEKVIRATKVKVRK